MSVEPTRSPRRWVLTVGLAIAMLALGLVVGWMLAGTGDESATWGAGAQLADRVDHYGYMQFAQAGPTIVIETRTGDEAVGVELAMATTTSITT